MPKVWILWSSVEELELRPTLRLELGLEMWKVLQFGLGGGSGRFGRRGGVAEAALWDWGLKLSWQLGWNWNFNWTETVMSCPFTEECLDRTWEKEMFIVDENGSSSGFQVQPDSMTLIQVRVQQ